MEKKGLKKKIRQWEEFYLKYFLLAVDFSGLADSDVKGCDFESCFLIVVPQGMTMNKVLSVTRRVYPVATVYSDLDGYVQDNNRKADHDYLVFVSRSIKRDEDSSGLSADDSKIADNSGVTLLERLLLGLWYFSVTGKHLDCGQDMFCSGSCDFEGNVIGVKYFKDLDVEVMQYYDFDDVAVCGDPYRVIFYLQTAAHPNVKF